MNVARERNERVSLFLQRTAAAGVALWMMVLGALPLFHLIGHRDDHTHVGGTAVAHGHEAWIQAGGALGAGLVLSLVVLLILRRSAPRSPEAAADVA